MKRNRESAAATTPADPEVLRAQLEDLCRMHDVGLELIDRLDDSDALLERILDEYQERIEQLPSDAFHPDASPEAAEKVKTLMMFASQAVALKSKADAARSVRDHSRELQHANARLTDALEDSRSARQRLDGVLATLRAGWMIVDPDGIIVHANPAAHEIAGTEPGRLPGNSIGPYVRNVDPDSAGEVTVETERTRRTLLVVRRTLPGSDGDIVTLQDLTEHYGRIEERHRLERIAMLFRTVSALNHKINNPLTALLGRAQMMQSLPATDPPTAKAFRVIAESARRIADLIQELGQVVKQGREEALEQLLEPPPGGGAQDG